MQTMKHKAALRLANGERHACAPTRSHQATGALGSARTFVARQCGQVRSAIRQKLGL